MSGGYQVIHGDLGAAASRFSAESREIGGLRDALNPPMADTGDAELNRILDALLLSVTALQAGFTRRLGAHGEELKRCYDTYVSADADTERLFSRVLGAYK